MDQITEGKEKTPSPTENGEKSTVCFICEDLYSDPKMLPCLHTFCLKCLVHYRSELQRLNPTLSVDRIPCPRCERLFAVPKTGFEDLSSNIFFGRLAQQRRLSSFMSVPGSDDGSDMCVPCAAAGDGIMARREPAKFLCFDCDEKLCDDCAAAHRKQKPSRHHKLEELTSANIFRNDPDRMQILTQRQASKCESHPTEGIKMFCRDCSQPICHQCVDQGHNDHDVDDIAKVAAEGRAQLIDGVQRVNLRVETFQKLLGSIGSQSRAFIKQMQQSEDRIRETAEEFVRLVESNKQDLLQETETIKQNTIQELEKAVVDVEFGISTMESFKEFATELIEKGTDSDVAFMWNKLETRRKQLETLHQDVSVCSVKFRANGTNSVKGNLLGKVTILDIDSSDPYVDSPSVIDIIPGSTSVAGVTVLDAELYIVRDLSPNVDIYSALEDHSPIRRLRLEGLRKPADIVSCAQNSSLYVSDSVGYVYRLEPQGQVLTRWQVEGEPQGLFVTTTGNVYVTCGDSRQVKEFTADGTSVRTVRFQQDIINSWQTLPLPESDRLIVCHGFESGKKHRICHVDASGRVLRVYGAANGSGPDRMDSPLRMALDQFGYVFVVDRNNDRIQLLSPNLIHVRDLISRSSYGIKQPRRIFLESSTGCLYVGLIDGRVVVFRVLDTNK